MSGDTSAEDIAKCTKLLGHHPSLAHVDDDVLRFFASVLSEGTVDSAGSLESFVSPYLDSLLIAEQGSESMRVLCASLYTELLESGAVTLRPVDAAGGGGSGVGGLGGMLGGVSLEAAAALRAALGSSVVDGDAGVGAKILEAPMSLGGSASSQGDNVILDLLWARESNRFLQRNKEMAVGSTERGARKAAKLAAKAALREDKRSAYLAYQAESAAAKELAAARRLGKSIAVTSGSVTYVPVIDRRQQDIHMEGVNLGYGGELLIVDAELHISQGKRYGLVGRNGYGKTTLLKAMARHDISGAGASRFPNTLRVLHVEQEISASADTVIETVLAADVERAMLMAEEARLEKRLEEGETGGEGGSSAAGAAAGGSGSSSSSSSSAEEEEGGGEDGEGSTVTAHSTLLGGGGSTGTAEDGLSVGGTSAAAAAAAAAAAEEPEPVLTLEAAAARLRVVAERLQAIDALSAESRAGAILAGLQFTPDMLSWPTSALSGGWRMRVALACALFVEPDMLLLDEPTNHLDVPSCLWLENYLLAYPATVIIVSHDRRFLNNVVTDIVHLDQRKLTYYKGDYDSFERTRAERAKHAERAGEAADSRRKHVQAFIDKFRYNAKRASLVQSRIKALERMEVMDVGEADDPRWKFEFPDPGPIGTPVLQILDVSFGYDPARPLFRGVNFGLDMESRVALVGPNGAGKSTLVKLILGELNAQEGHVARNAKLRTACFTQHHVAQLDLSVSPLVYLSRLFPGNKEEVIRAHLSQFGLAAELASQRIGTLSGGQKSRVAFALCSWKRPHLLVLDEPTNHLDIDTIDALIVALANFQGGVLLVSHDQHFIESVADEIYVVGEGRVAKFKGDFGAYRKIAAGEKAQKVQRY